MTLVALEPHQLRAKAKRNEREAHRIRWGPALEARAAGREQLAHWLELKASMLDWRADALHALAARLEQER